MPNGNKNGKFTKKEDADIQTNAEESDNYNLDELIKSKLIKDIIRSGVLAGINNEIMLKRINSGILGYETTSTGDLKMRKNDDNENEPIPKTIGLRQFYKYKKKAMSLIEIQNDFTEFIKIDYALQVSSVKSMLQVLINIMFTAVMSEKNMEKKAKLAHNLFKDMPNYTQFLDIKKSAIKHGRLKITDEELKHDTNSLASNN